MDATVSAIAIATTDDSLSAIQMALDDAIKALRKK